MSTFDVDRARRFVLARNWPSALEAAALAAEKSPDDASVWYFKGSVEMAAKRPGDALVSALRATSLAPQDAKAWL
ncbi:MAG TPA: hypothetical protein VMG61_13430, partial [Usitatibacter sp.]|nr:hypothetical protein [Usitatibacter sp.]